MGMGSGCTHMERRILCIILIEYVRRGEKKAKNPEYDVEKKERDKKAAKKE
jgi:hypothetical protein